MKKILIVEDEVDQLEIIKELISLEDEFEVLTAEDGVKALEALESNEIDLMILDLNLPEKSGINVLESLRANPERYGNPKVVIYSNYSNEVNKQYVQQFDIDEYLLKLEVEPQQLLMLVKQHLHI